MVKCSICGKFVSLISSAMCVDCPFISHKGCVSIAEATDIPMYWNCPKCIKTMSKSDSSTTHLKTISSSDIPSHLTAGSSVAKDGIPCGNESEVQALRREMAEYMGELREFRKEMLEFRTSVAGIGKRLDAVENRLDILEQRDSASEPKNIQELENTIHELRVELNGRDQEALLSDLDIGGLTEVKDENLTHAVIVLATKLGVKIEDRDIVFAERVGVRNTTESSIEAGRRIIVRLTRRHLRDDLLRAARVRRNFSTQDMGLSGPSRRIYINERLTRLNRKLFYQVREECRRSNWRYSWTKKGRIYVREADGKQSFPVLSAADIIRIFKSKTV